MEELSGAFGRPKVDESAPWRVAETSAIPEAVNKIEQAAVSSLNVTSRSPPPDVPSAKAEASADSSSKAKGTHKAADETDVVLIKDSASTTGTRVVSSTVGSEIGVVVGSKVPGVIGQPSHSVVAESVVKTEIAPETKPSFTPRGQVMPLPGSAAISPVVRISELAHSESEVDSSHQVCASLLLCH